MLVKTVGNYVVRKAPCDPFWLEPGTNLFYILVDTPDGETILVECRKECNKLFYCNSAGEYLKRITFPKKVNKYIKEMIKQIKDAR